MTMHRAPRDCPVCRARLEVTQLGCPDCGTGLTGQFQPCEFCGLTEDERDLLRVFLMSRGNMKELERHLGVSYPTARSRFDELLGRLGLSEGPDRDPRLATLDALARGELTVADARTRLDTHRAEKNTRRNTD
jgi:hypothetical protein